MRRLPPWIVFFLLALAVLMLVVGWEERHEVGYVPVVLGVVWLLFTAAAAKNVLADEEH
ncbi:MAG: hypothetical protein KDC33_12515 [Thermoleophilia bacterium]|nr:hypothetical protein [Thermoleophilia bacterium]